MGDLQLACKAYFVLGQNISIDERMVTFKGRIGMKQYIKDKPTKWGFKLWILASSDSGYTYKFQAYTGKRLTQTNNGLGYDVAMDLMDGLFRQDTTSFVIIFIAVQNYVQTYFRGVAL